MQSWPKHGPQAPSGLAWPPFSKALLACLSAVLLCAQLGLAASCYPEKHPYPVIAAPKYDLTGPDWNSRVLNMRTCNDYLAVLLYQE